MFILKRFLLMLCCIIMQPVFADLELNVDDIISKQGKLKAELSFNYYSKLENIKIDCIS